MALNRPTFKPNIKASTKSLERKTAFYDLKPDTVTRLRVLPPVAEDGLIFYKVTNHFQLKNEEDQGTALSCLCEHGTAETGDDCYLCDLVKHLRRTGDKGDDAVASKLRASPRWYVQAYIYDKDSDGYIGPKLIGLSKTTAEALNDLMVAQDDSGDGLFCDEDEGQDITITRKGAGLKTKYSVAPTGKVISLDEAIPGWEDKILTDVWASFDLKLEDRDGQRRAVQRTYGDQLDWETINAKLS